MKNQFFLVYFLAISVLTSCVNSQDEFISDIESALGISESNIDNKDRRDRILMLIDSLVFHEDFYDYEQLNIYQRSINSGDSLRLKLGINYPMNNRGKEVKNLVGIAIVHDSLVYPLSSNDHYETEELAIPSSNDSVKIEVMLFFNESDTLYRKMVMFTP